MLLVRWASLIDRDLKRGIFIWVYKEILTTDQFLCVSHFHGDIHVYHFQGDIHVILLIHSGIIGSFDIWDCSSTKSNWFTDKITVMSNMIP